MNETPALVLFVCTGNTCRSPMAAALLNARSGLRPRWRAESAGVAAGIGEPASHGASFVMGEWGIDLSGHRSRPFTPALGAAADLVVGICPPHAAAIVEASPALRTKTLVLGSFLPDGPRPIADPFGGGIDGYRRARDDIDRALDRFAAYLRDFF